MKNTRDQIREALRERILRGEEPRSVLLDLLDQYEDACLAALDVQASLPWNAPLATWLGYKSQRYAVDAEIKWAHTARERLNEIGRHTDQSSPKALHSDVILRDGPSGPRPALLAGPDVWEVVATYRQSDASGDEAIAQTAVWASLADDQVRAALSYYSQFPDEIDRWIRKNQEQADQERGAWRRGQDVAG